MIHIVDRYCKDFLMHSTDLNQLKEELETYIHAIDIEIKEIETSKERCDKVVQLYGLNEKINWNFLNTDTLKYNKFDNKMDFVIGNPPYVRVHNLNEELDSVKEYLFGNGGMTNLYIVFYEIGLKMLNDTGILTYITPSSFFTSIAGNNMRNYIIDNKLLECLCDLKHFQPFNATTYTTIVTLNKSEKFEKVKYYEFDENTLKPYFVEELNISDYYINNNFYFSKISKLKLLKNIIYNNNVANVFVKNGYATLADKVFINDFEFESKYIIPIVKASRGKWSKVFYPYDDKANLIEEKDLKKDSILYNYLLDKKETLLKRSIEPGSKSNWFAFGRTQGINDTYKEKISINSLIKESKDLKIVDVKAGQGVYSGLYIISDEVSKDEIKKALLDEEFGEYVSLLGKYKSGGYYTFSSKDVKTYLDYKIGKKGVNNAN